MIDHKDFIEWIFNSSCRCPSCGLQGKPQICPKCGRNACDKCIAVDNTDCMFCGPHGDIAKECFANLHRNTNP